MNVDDSLSDRAEAVRELVDRSVDIDQALASTLSRRPATDRPTSDVRRWRRLAPIAAATLLVAGAIGLWVGSSGSEPGRIAPATTPSADTSAPSPSTTEPRDGNVVAPPPTSPTSSATVADSENRTVGVRGVGAFAERFSATATFEALPMISSTSVGGAEGGDGRVEIVAGDLVAADAVGTPRPNDRAGFDDWIDDVYDLGLDVAADDGRLVLPLPMFPGISTGTATSEQRRDELGFDLVDADRYATVNATDSQGIGYFGVYVGDGLELGEEFVTLEDGVETLGTGEDDHRDVDETTPVRSLGRPIRAIRSDSAIALTSSTSEAVSWRTGGGRLIDDDRMAAAARALDTRELVGLSAYAMDFSARDTTPSASAAATITEPFSVLAAATAVDGNGRLVTLITYVFDTTEAATAMTDVIDAAWREPSTVSGTAAADGYATVEVTSTDRVVTVAALHGPESSPPSWFRLFAMNEALFTHRPPPPDDDPASGSSAPR